MNNKGWIKLWRKVGDNPIFNTDRTAWHIFEILLLNCDNGVWAGGRYQLSRLSNIRGVTLYKALKRLEKAKMVTLTSNTRYTTIHICKWSDYQGAGNRSGNTSSNTSSNNGGNTLIKNIYKNKELRSSKLLPISKEEWEKGRQALKGIKK